MVWVWTVIAGLALLAVLVLVVALVVGRRTRRRRLKERFGPEYDRTAAAVGVPAAEMELAERERLHDALEIRALSPTERTEFTQRWDGVQTTFVDDPADALREADRVVTDVMHARGYPAGDFERRAVDISVDHPTLVADYRAAHAVSHAPPGETMTTETQRQAVVHYRTLVDALLASEHSASNGDTRIAEAATPQTNPTPPEDPGRRHTHRCDDMPTSAQTQHRSAPADAPS